MIRRLLGRFAAALLLGTLPLAAQADPAAGAKITASQVVTLTPVRSTAASRARDGSRRGLLVAARHRVNVPVSSGLKRADYLQKMRGQFRNKDSNQDGLVSWQGKNAPENLANQAQCVIVQYKFQPATSVKDKTKPGQMIDTPAQWTPIDWVTFLEVLGTTKFEGGKCLATGLVTVRKCEINGKTIDIAGPAPKGCLLRMSNGQCVPGGSNPLGGLDRALKCMANPADPICLPADAQECAAKGGKIVEIAKQQGCDEWEQFGPNSEAAFIKVAALNFDAEDWNRNGKINGKEGEFLCNR